MYNYAKRTRGQTHPLGLIVLIMPIVFFHPLKAAYTRTYPFSLYSYSKTHMYT